MILLKIESKKGQAKISRALKGTVALGRAAAKFPEERDYMLLKIRNTATARLGKAQFNGSTVLNRITAQDAKKQKADEKCNRSCFPGLFHQHNRRR